MDSVSWTVFDARTGVKVEIIATEEDGGLKFEIRLVEGIADLNGFFLDLGGDGGELFGVGGGRANNSINMKGEDQNGEEIGGFDYAVKLNSTGIGADKGDTMDKPVLDGEGNVLYYVEHAFIPGLTLADLLDEDGAPNAIVGVRATSVGVPLLDEDGNEVLDDDGAVVIVREDSLKLTAPPDEGLSEIPCAGGHSGMEGDPACLDANRL